MNARQLLHFFGERLCNRAQWEIRQVAEQMLAVLRPALSGDLWRRGSQVYRSGSVPGGEARLREVRGGKATL